MRRFNTFVTKSLAWTMAIQNPSLKLAVEPHRNVSYPIPGIIPGESNLKFCNESRDTDLFSIERVSVNPTPPLMEEDITIYLYGTFLQNITQNATWHWLAAEPSNHAQNDSGTWQFCDAMTNIEQPNPHHEERPSCPPVKGFAMISIFAWVPWIVGEGDYYVKFDARTKEGERIYCLDAEFALRYPEKGKHSELK